MHLDQSELALLILFMDSVRHLTSPDISFWRQTLSYIKDAFGYHSIIFHPYSEHSFNLPIGFYHDKSVSLSSERQGYSYYQKNFLNRDPFNPFNYSPELKKKKVVLLKDVHYDLQSDNNANLLAYRKEKALTDQMIAPIFFENELVGCLYTDRALGEEPFSEKDIYLFGIIMEIVANRYTALLELNREKQQKKLLYTAINTVNEGVILLDFNCSPLYYNDSAQKILDALIDADCFEDALELFLNRYVFPHSTGIDLVFGVLNGYRYTFTPTTFMSTLGNATINYILHIEPESESISLTAEKLSKYALTKRELEILEMLLKGNSNQQIADALYVSIHTVKSHVANLYRKIGISNRIELINIFKKH